MSAKDEDFLCSYCWSKIIEVYGYCTACPNNTMLCQKCIASGVEYGCHKNDHPIISMRLDLTVLEAGWSAAEDLQLLDAVLHFGPNDWGNVSKYMGSVHTAEEIKEHYSRINPTFIWNRANVHDPPRLPSTSVPQDAARGDFQVDCDNDAEGDLSDLDGSFIYEPIPGWNAEERSLGSKLFFAIVDSYVRRLGERKQRHEIIRKYGLIQPQKNVLRSHRSGDSSTQWRDLGGERQDSSCSGVSSQMSRTLTKFSQFLNGCEMNKLFEGLKLEADYMSKLNELYELRRNGVTSFYMASVYKKYSKRRQEHLKERRKYLLNPYLSCKNIFDGRAGKFPHLVNQSRRPVTPLDVSKLPGYDKLTTKERELCSAACIAPDSFVEFKNILIAECVKQGGLRLAQARTLIKIDVNKTRKLYDFLIEEGVIYQS